MRISPLFRYLVCLFCRYLRVSRVREPLAINGVLFGTSGDIPFVGDFDGDGYDDMALLRASENRVLVNLYDRKKPKYEHYADLNGVGVSDLEITVPVQNVVAVSAADIDLSRPKSLPLATQEEVGSEVNLRHGWTCISIILLMWINGLLRCNMRVSIHWNITRG